METLLKLEAAHVIGMFSPTERGLDVARGWIVGVMKRSPFTPPTSMWQIIHSQIALGAEAASDRGPRTRDVTTMQAAVALISVFPLSGKVFPFCPLMVAEC